MKHRVAKKVKDSGAAILERQYEEMFGPLWHHSVIPSNQSLKQPSPYRTIQTYVTYGAYEEPV